LNALKDSQNLKSTSISEIKKASNLLAFLYLVRKAGLEPARAMLTTPSRWRVYQFHHFRKNFI
jgi:hypothetical protein